jgi:hypothetical protein
MPNTSPNYSAGGNIGPSIFVKMDSTDHRVVVCGENGQPVGISHEGTEEVPVPSAATWAATSGNPIKVYGEGDSDVLLLLGATVTTGQRLKSSVNGLGKPVKYADPEAQGWRQQNYGAIALEGGTGDGTSTSEKIRVFVTFGTVRPYPTGQGRGMGLE